ncbi:MAG TPA: hypothetical protein VN019_04950, partial [Oxalicibacterium sp.]|nr:hypothetical protein [Oxalicibacterium sp.]
DRNDQRHQKETQFAGTPVAPGHAEGLSEHGWITLQNIPRQTRNGNDLVPPALRSRSAIPAGLLYVEYANVRGALQTRLRHP